MKHTKSFTKNIFVLCIYLTMDLLINNTKLYDDKMPLSVIYLNFLKSCVVL